MAEAVAAFYTVETAVEGAAVGAYAVTRPTVPLHVRFHKLQVPDSTVQSLAWRPTLGHSMTIVKGKAYIFGGDIVGSSPNASMRILTLPTMTHQLDVDVQVAEPSVSSTRPLQSYSDTASAGVSSERDGQHHRQSQRGVVEPRSEHAATSIGSTVYILTGRPAGSIDSKGQREKNTDLFDCGIIHAYSTQTNSWTSLAADTASCHDGIPAPRTGSSCTSSLHPQAATPLEESGGRHGTIILHGGYDEAGIALRDIWAFDVRSRIWSRWPNIPEPRPHEISGEGRIVTRGSTVCRVGDGFGKIMFLDTEIVQGDFMTETSGPHHGEKLLKPLSLEWEIRAYDMESKEQGKEQTKLSTNPIECADRLPVPRNGAGFLPITTGAGRFYNLYFMGSDGADSVLTDFWSLQVQPQATSAAALKDGMRKLVGKETGLNQWTRCEVIESTKDEGPLELPRALHGFAADTWTDLGGANIVIWGGTTGDGDVVNEGWLLTVD